MKNKKYKYFCNNYKHICPFVEGDLGNCEIDFREVNINTDRCKEFKLDKDSLE